MHNISTSIPLDHKHSLPQGAIIEAIYATVPAFSGNPCQRVHCLAMDYRTFPIPEKWAIVRGLFPNALAYPIPFALLRSFSAFVTVDLDAPHSFIIQTQYQEA
jgi:hypothetical protein